MSNTGQLFELVQRTAVQASVTLNDTYIGTWSGHDQYAYTVDPMLIWYAYVARQPYPSIIVISESACQYYAGYPDGYAYTNRFYPDHAYDAETGLYYAVGSVSDGPTRTNPSGSIFASVQDALWTVHKMIYNNSFLAGLALGRALCGQ